jgi:hypothetical protein
MHVALALLLLVTVAVAIGLAWMRARGRRTNWLHRLRTPAGRANALLRQVLGTEEYRHLVRCGYLDLPSPMIAGRTYRIPFAPGRVEVIEQGRIIARLCVVSIGWIPAADMVLTHKLLIEGDEARYLRVANHFPAGGARRIGSF